MDGGAQAPQGWAAGACFGKASPTGSSTKAGSKEMSEALRKLLNQGNPQQPVITPHVGILTLHFQLYGCEDLKAKRKVFTALKAVWGKEPDLAVAETADQDALDCATWTIAALGGSSQQIAQRLDQIEKAIQERIDAAILDVHREIL